MIGSHNKTIADILGRGPIHPFPARMAPGIALEALGESKSPLRVLDPMTGSGTVLAVARANGHHAIGIDLDPLAVLLSGVWTRTVNPAEVNDKAADVLDRARLAFDSLTTGRAYPHQIQKKNLENSRINRPKNSNFNINRIFTIKNELKRRNQIDPTKQSEFSTNLRRKRS